MRVLLTILAVLAAILLWNTPSHACGVYLSRPADMAVKGADGKLLKRSWSAIIAADDGQVTFTMANDYLGDAAIFALLFPLPEVLTSEQVTVGDPEIFARLRSYASPRLVTVSEAVLGWNDPRLAARVTKNWQALFIVFVAGVSLAWLLYKRGRAIDALAIMALMILMIIIAPQFGRYGALTMSGDASISAGAVTEHARFTAGEYDLVFLGAENSQDILSWLKKAGYGVPPQAAPLIQEYIDDGMSFLFATVSLDRLPTEYTGLRPLRITYKAEKLLVPIRLGLINSIEAQNLDLFVLTPEDTVIPANFPLAFYPSPELAPEEEDFGAYADLLYERARIIGPPSAIVMAFTGPVPGCNFCPAPPLSREELRSVGVSWEGDAHLTWLRAQYSAESTNADIELKAVGRQLFEPVYLRKGEAAPARHSITMNTLITNLPWIMGALFAAGFIIIAHRRRRAVVVSVVLALPYIVAVNLTLGPPPVYSHGCGVDTKSDLVNFSIAQEAFFDDHGRYHLGASDGPIPGFVPASSATVTTLQADDKGFTALATAANCAMTWNNADGGLGKNLFKRAFHQ